MGQKGNARLSEAELCTPFCEMLNFSSSARLAPSEPVEAFLKSHSLSPTPSSEICVYTKLTVS